MSDVLATTSTTSTITVGGTVSDTLEAAGDHDWFRIDLQPGDIITVTLNGVTLSDPYLTIRDSFGHVLYENDDSGPGLGSQQSFASNGFDTFYIDVGSWHDLSAGTYQLTVTAWTPPPVATIDQIANQLVNGYWEGDDHHFAVSPGGTITVDLSALTGPGQSLATAALQAWTDLIGVTFVPVTSGAQITFDDNESGAFTEDTYSNGTTTSAHVNVSSQWLFDYGTSIGGYAFQAYIHEIGHALGLGHAGNYNTTATFPYDASFQNDDWVTSIMSYFSPEENPYFRDQHFTDTFLATPMLADFVAVSGMYGLSTTTNAGNTTYGYNSNAVNSVFHADVYSDVAYMIFDTGGTDTLDFSAYSGAQTIDLRPEEFSSVLGNGGNVTIARGVTIENAIGGSGNDTIRGNSADNVLIGGAGNDNIVGWEGDDVMIGGPGDDILSGTDGFDTASYADATAGIIMENGNVNYDGRNSGVGFDQLFSVEHVIGSNFADSLIGYAFYNEWFEGGGGNDSLSAGDGDDILTGGAGADTLSGGNGSDTFRDTAAGLNGDTITDFRTGDRIVITDANANGFSFNVSGNTLIYSGGTLTFGSALTGPLVAHAAASGGIEIVLNAHDPDNDFNGDGRSDILWRNDNGALTDWLGTTSGGFTPNGANLLEVVDTGWQIAGTGDFDGDHRDDVLWRRADGALTDWRGLANGGLGPNGGNLLTVVDPQWQVAGVGDFNGDGRDDVLWHRADGAVTDWLGTAFAGLDPNGANFLDVVNTQWQIAGVGDFNGDGKDDILWRSTDGRITNWLGTPTGAFSDNASNGLNGVSLDWRVAGIGDFNGDGRDDILWRNTDGRITDWLGTASGGFTPNSGNFYTSLGTDWSVANIGDFNGDTRDDILFRNSDGRMTDWLGTATGSFSDNLPNAYQAVDAHWHTQPHFALI